MVEFRRATLEDVEVLAKLRVEMLFETKHSETDLRTLLYGNTVHYLCEAMADGSYLAWVAEEDGQIVAMGGLTFYRLPPNDWCPNGHTAYLSAMYTKPAHRKNGIAKQLLKLLMKEAKDRGCERILLHATAMGRPLYETAGIWDSTDSMAYYPYMQNHG